MAEFRSRMDQQNQESSTPLRDDDEMNLWPLQKDCNEFYGNPGMIATQWARWEQASLTTVPVPWSMWFVDGKQRTLVKAIRIHQKCADSLKVVLGSIWDAVGQDQSAIETLHYHYFSGSYNQRPMRGGAARSMHGFGAAIDFDSEENQQHAMKHLFQSDSLIVTKFKAEGWTWGGDWSPASVDAMHVQAARVH